MKQAWKKFKNKIGDHMELRKISDEICREHELSVLENSSFYGGQKGEYWIHSNGGKTHRDILKEDVEICIEASYNFDDFIRNLKRLGYEVDPSRGSVKSPDWERAIRLTSVGFTAELLENRFYKNFHSPKQYQTQKLNSISLKNSVKKNTTISDARKMTKIWQYTNKNAVSFQSR